MIKRTASILFFLLLVQFSIEVSAQHYFGLWEGNNEYSFGWSQPQKVVLELYKENDSTISGASHLYYKGNKYEHYNVKGTINVRNQTIQVSEVSELSVKLGFLQKNSSGTYYLKLTCYETACTLKGHWKPKSPIPFAARSINTYFRRTISTTAPQPTTNDSTVSKAETPHVLQRKPDIQSLIEIDKNKTDSISIQIYDNGDIDQDSISLYLDDAILIHKQKISANPINLHIPTSKLHSISKLKLIAESLGSIPPCTAVMIIKIGKKRYEISLSSDFEKNGVVEFFLK